MLFFIRLFSAICLYIGLTQSNNLLDTLNNSILVFGYRSLLILSPLFCRYFSKFQLSIALFLNSIGCIFLINNVNILGCLFFSAGLSISGFLIKKIVTENIYSAGWNKIALSLGNIIVGVLIYILFNYEIYYWYICLILSITSVIMAYYFEKNYNNKIFFQDNYDQQSNKNTTNINSLLIHISWFFIGSSVGIRIFGLYSILPQYLKNSIGFIPDWYGMVLIIYSLLTIFMQIPAISKNIYFSFNISITILALSLIILAIPELFRIETFLGALIWCTILSLEEIVAPYIDFYAAGKNAIFTKEVSISIGAGLCVFMMRYFQNPLYIIITALIFLFLGYMCVKLHKKSLN